MEEEDSRAKAEPGGGPASWLDGGIAVLLAALALRIRRSGLPTDGLWFDDSWVATGAAFGRLSQLNAAGSAHPAFTLLLRIWHDVVGGGLERLALPALVAGVLGPPVFYLGLRRLSFARSISFLGASLLVVAQVHAFYSGRVKPYTIDTAMVMLIAVYLPVLARRTWTWRFGLAWTVGAIVVGSFSGYLMVSTAVAIGVLVLNPHGDRAVRIGSLLGQGAVQLGIYLTARGATDLDAIEAFMETAYDGHLSLHGDPAEMAREILLHLGRVADVYSGGPMWILAPLALVAIGGLAVTAWRRQPGDRAIASMFLLALVVLAFVGGVLDRFPFGPATRDWFSASGASGGRHSLWLIPAVAVGASLVLEWVREAAGRGKVRRSFDLLLLVACALVLTIRSDTVDAYPQPGGRTATQFAERAAGDDGLIILADNRTYTFAASTSRSVSLAETPEHQVGFTPLFKGNRAVGVGHWALQPDDPDAIEALVRDENLVVLFGGRVFGPASIAPLQSVLEAQGFVLQEEFAETDWYQVAVMGRP